ncbi:MAG: histidyl-tRNA synthetase [Actinomycetota bacterium]
MSAFADAVGRAGYGQVVPPLLEDIGVFSRIGEATDVVAKEMYDFVDRGGRHVALRPEQTASVCRAFVEHRPTTPFKAWYAGPNFRYEKPQRGRYRQFDQVGVEVLGTDDPMVDVEVITLAWDFLRSLGLRRVELVVNSLGEPEDRERYVEALRSHLRRADGLTAESRATLERNPLRVLDSKRAPDAPIIAGAPTIDAHWSPEATDHFGSVIRGLGAVGVPFTVDHRLVRGLDYYRRTTFEFRGLTLDSAQNALGGGGRYDGLVQDLGGPPTAGVGFAIGVDRTLLACDDEGTFPTPDPSVDVFVVDTSDGTAALAITTELRRAGFAADRAYDARSMKAQMKAADRSGAAITVIVGPDEAESMSAVMRPMRSDAEQRVVPRSELVMRLNEVLSPPPGGSTIDPTPTTTPG